MPYTVLKPGLKAGFYQMSRFSQRSPGGWAVWAANPSVVFDANAVG